MGLVALRRSLRVSLKWAKVYCAGSGDSHDLTAARNCQTDLQDLCLSGPLRHRSFFVSVQGFRTQINSAKTLTMFACVDSEYKYKVSLTQINSARALTMFAVVDSDYK